jgi:hypothetical protein
MSAMHRWPPDGTDPDEDEITIPVDVLALTGERAANDPGGALSFFVAGPPPSVLRARRGRSVVTRARGRVKRIQEDLVILGTPGSPANEVTVGYHLPASIDLRPLVGRRVHLTLDEEEEASGDRCEQTLTVRTHDERVWLIARWGEIEYASHALGNVVLRLTLSPDEGGPLVVATPELHHAVAPGGEARMRIGLARYVVELLSRDASGHAAYLIADAGLWH